MPYYGFYGFDPMYLLFVLPALLISILAQGWVKGSYRKYSAIPNTGRITGREAAEAVCRAAGAHQTRVELSTGGTLSDHYDPKQNVIRLSSDVYHGDSVAAVGIAAHEAGHAAQYAAGYAPIRIRNSFIPLCNIGSSMSYLVILAGVIFQANILLLIGVGLFSLTTIFHLLTLPVEFNASRRAIETLERSSLLNEEELTGAEKVLKSAAMTYVAAAVSSIAVLLYYMFRFLGNGRKE